MHYEARQRASKQRLTSPHTGKESELHAQIIDECRRRGWLIGHHSRMDCESTCPTGSPDFIVFLDGGRVLAFECKTKTGKLSLEQAGVIAWAAKLGHAVAVVRSFEDFLTLTNTKTKL